MLEPAPPSASRSTMTELMMPNMANNLGHVFGGVILSLIDRVAAVAAIRHARQPFHYRLNIRFAACGSGGFSVATC